MMRVAFVVCAIALAGCSSSQSPVSIEGVAAQNLLAQPLPEYAAKLRLARQITVSCERYDFNNRMQVALSASRPDTTSGRLGAIRQGPGIELATNVEIRSFEARHAVEVGVDKLCAAGDAEVSAQSGISALLMAS